MEVGGPCNGRGGLMNRSIYTLEEEPPEPREPATARLAALYRSARRKLAGLRSQEEAAVVPRGYDDELTEADDDEGVVVESGAAVDRAREADDRAALAAADAAVAAADKALGEGGAGSDHGWLQRTFARTAGLYRLRGYGGRVAVSVQLGFVAESIAADVAPGEPGAGDAGAAPPPCPEVLAADSPLAAPDEWPDSPNAPDDQQPRIVEEDCF